MKVKIIAVSLVLLSLFLTAAERPQKYWIFFTSKESRSLSKTTAHSIGISERAMQRRAKMGITSVTAADLPVSPSYLQQMREAGIVIDNTSRWLNAATAYLTRDQVALIAAFPFVREIEPVAVYHRRILPEVNATPAKRTENLADQKFAYGSSLAQMTQINAVKVHNIGISGRGVLIGMLDTGFRWRVHEAMQNMNVVAEYDFIQKDTVTANDEFDSPSQDSHGTSTMSLVGGYKEGELISPAFNAYFMLGKTEYVPTETNVEEDNWVAAVEWMEQNGVDVVSSSLGYSEFDGGEKSYTYSDMNGRTATTTIAAAIAARNGVVVVNAMGNEAASSWKYLTSPADADSIVSVGAVSSTGTYAGFSSIGPTSDGRTKPDVAAHGIGTYCAIPPGKITSYSGGQQGTSLATPLVAGVAAMLLSAHPELTPVQVRDALRSTASNAATPNNQIGWGIVNAYAALLSFGMAVSTDPEISMTTDSNYSIAFYVVSPVPVKKDSIQLFYSVNSGVSFSSVPMTLTDTVDSATSSGKYGAVIPGIGPSTEVMFYVRSSDQNGARTSPYGAPANLYSTILADSLIITDPPFPRTFALRQNYPNPFNPATTISYDLPVSDFVSLTVYDVLGKEVAVLVKGFQRQKSYSVRFNAAGLASGVYFYRLKTSTFSEVKKMVFLK